MASKQDNYLRMHHPSLYKGMKKGGEVKKKKYYAEGGKNTDTVPAMLTPGEVVLNAEQQEALGKLVGMKPAALFEKIGIPGFAGGGVADKKDALVQYYENGAVVPEKYGGDYWDNLPPNKKPTVLDAVKGVFHTYRGDTKDRRYPGYQDDLDDRAAALGRARGDRQSYPFGSSDDYRVARKEIKDEVTRDRMKTRRLASKALLAK